MGDIDLKAKTVSKSEWQHDLISLKKDTLRKLEYNVARSQTYIEELYPIIHLYFSKLVRLEYNFTYNELIEEMDKFEDEYGLINITETKKTRLFEYLERLIDFEYNKIDRNQEEIKGMFKEFMEIVMDFSDMRKIKEEEKEQKRGFLGIFGSKEKTKEPHKHTKHIKKKDIEKDTIEQESIETQAMETIIKEQKQDNQKDIIEHAPTTEIAEEEKLQEIEISITEEFERLHKETEDAIKQQNLVDAKRLYHALREKYMELPEEAKKTYKRDLWNIYNLLKG